MKKSYTIHVLCMLGLFTFFSTWSTPSSALVKIPFPFFDTTRLNALSSLGLNDNRPKRPLIIFSTPIAIRLTRKFSFNVAGTAPSVSVKKSLYIDSMPLLPSYKGIFGNFKVSSPIHEQMTLTYQLGKDDIVTAKIFNVLGIEVTTLFSEYQFAGQQKKTLNVAEKVQTGIYILRVSAGNQQMAKRIQIL